MQAVESWLAQFPNLIAALAAVATLGATIVALWASLSAQKLSRPHVRANLTTHEFALLDGKPVLFSKSPEHAHFVSVALKNHSAYPVRIERHALWVQFPLRRTAAIIPAFEETFSEGEKVVEPFSDKAVPWTTTEEFFSS